MDVDIQVFSLTSSCKIQGPRDSLINSLLPGAGLDRDSAPGKKAATSLKLVEEVVEPAAASHHGEYLSMCVCCQDILYPVVKQAV